ncbi:MAG TPA: YezD family protein [Gammaproteobacteria bacterium]|nr:YezD family protein [Gammaproteobacteria bacterium]
MALVAHDRQEDASSEVIVKQILDSLKGLRYGSIELIVHDGQIVQIERNEKLRLDSPTRSAQ